MKSVMEKIFGMKVRSAAVAVIDGLKDTEDSEIIFFEVPTGASPGKVFNNLTTASDPPNARNGGACEYGCSITTPDGVVYNSLQTNSDVAGWRKDIELGAARHGLALGKVKRRTFIVDGGRRYPLSRCRVEFL